MKKITLIAIALLLPLVMFAQKAEEWYQKGENYYFGKNGVSKDYAASLKWALKAANKGHKNAQYRVGMIYILGQGVTKDGTEAEKWFRKSAEQGHTVAQFNLALLYKKGDGVTKDDTEAVKWYRKAAEQGYPNAQSNLGYMYYMGYGVEKDYELAKKWYERAIAQGNAYAMEGMGKLYEYGHGVTQNYLTAKEMYKKALNKDSNNSDAKDGLARVEKILSEQSNNNNSLVTESDDEKALHEAIKETNTKTLRKYIEKGNWEAAKALDDYTKCRDDFYEDDDKLFLLDNSGKTGYDKYNEDVKLIKKLYQDAVDFTKAGKDELLEKDYVGRKFPKTFIYFYTKYPQYDKQGIVKQARALIDFNMVNNALYELRKLPYGWHIEKRTFGLEEVPVWKTEVNDDWFKKIDEAIAICNNNSSGSAFSSYFKKSLPKLKTKRADGEVHLKEQRMEYEAAIGVKRASEARLNECIDIDEGRKSYPAVKSKTESKNGASITFVDGTYGTLFYDSRKGWYIDPGIISFNRYYKTYKQAEKALYLYKKYKYEARDGKQ